MLVNVNPKNDYAFKTVFGSERHARVLIHLLNAILVPGGLRVQSVRVLNPISEIRQWDDKRLILDVKAVDQLGRLYNIEMQMVPAPSFPGRFLYYSVALGAATAPGSRFTRVMWTDTAAAPFPDDLGLLRPPSQPWVMRVP